MKTDKQSLEKYFIDNYETYENMIKYCIEKIRTRKSEKAMMNLGLYYDKIEPNFELMLKYYNMAIKKGSSDALNLLGSYYRSIKEYNIMKKYYIKAYNKKNIESLYLIATYYDDISKDYDKAEKYYLMYYKSKDNIRESSYIKLLSKLYHLYFDKKIDWNLSLLYYIEYLNYDVKDMSIALRLVENSCHKIPKETIHLLFVSFYDELTYKDKLILYKHYTKEKKECFICYKEEPIITLFKCNHEICYECLQHITTCPYCRMKI